MAMTKAELMERLRTGQMGNTNVDQYKLEQKSIRCEDVLFQPFPLILI